MIRQARALVVVALAALTTMAVIAPRPARAFDSSGAEYGTMTWTLPFGRGPWPFHLNYRELLPIAGYDLFTVDRMPEDVGPNYMLDITGYRLAGDADLELQSNVVYGLYDCARDAMPENEGSAFHLERCRMFAPSHEPGIDPGWVRTRRRWNIEGPQANVDDGHRPEHMMIAQLAAHVAGFDATTLMNSPFWIRYPTENHLLVSPQSADSNAVPVDERPRLVVGQSWIPTSMGDAESHAVRGIYLPELAQLPDQSHAIWDWVTGDELCPVSGVSDDLFGAANKVSACHDFPRIGGAVNMTHFLPASRDVYRYYHQLAMTRMGQCNALVAWEDIGFDDDPDFTTWSEFEEWSFEDGDGIPAPRYRSPEDTPIHECEKEAMVYEMMAQHFLQDSWSTGHMWRRWGFPELSSYPETLGASRYRFGVGPVSVPVAEDVVFPPVANREGRRFTIAAVVAAYAGTIHGAKGVLVDTLRGKLGQFAADIAQGRPFLDDPLCAPDYQDPHDRNVAHHVEWADAGGERFAGAGDLFWAPTFAGKAKISSDPPYVEQRTRLITCAARSLRDVYEAGPHYHGPLDPPLDYEGQNIDDADSESGDDAYCFTHWATNASMLGAIGPLFVSHVWKADGSPSAIPFNLLIDGLYAVVNAVLISQQGFGHDVSYPDKADRDAFRKTLSKRLKLDSKNLELMFVYNAIKNPNGTESANLTAVDPTAQDFTKFLNTPRNAPLAPPVGQNAAVGAPAMYYADTLAPPGPPQPERQRYVQQMFWKAHMPELCASPTFADDLMGLRQRCLDGAIAGGDPDACTACVDMAEMVMPMCGYGDGDGENDEEDILGRNHCQNFGGIPAGLPVAWYDDEARLDELADTQGWDWKCFWPPYFQAVRWCTDTEQVDLDSGAYGRRGVGVVAEGADDDTCTENDPLHDGWFTDRTVRLASMSDEAPPELVGPPGMISAVVDEVDFTPITSYYTSSVFGDHCTYKPEHSIEPRIQAILEALPIYNSDATMDPAYFPPDDFVGEKTAFAYEPCGPVQRFSYWDGDCDDAFGMLSNIPTLGDVPFGTIDPETGMSWSPTATKNEPRCSVFQDRQMKGECGIGTCRAGGACGPENEAPPEVVTFDPMVEDEPCADTAGCCVSANELHRCVNGVMVVEKCDSVIKGCGWNGSAYDCQQLPSGSADPSGQHPIACP